MKNEDDLKKVALLWGTEPAKADSLYQKFLEEDPNDHLARLEYVKFLNGTGQWDRVFDLVSEYPKTAPTYPQAVLLQAFSYIALERFDQVIEGFLDYFTYEKPELIIESHIIYCLNFLGLQEDFDYERTKLRLEKMIADRPGITESKAQRLYHALENRLRQVYKSETHTSGFVLFIDLVDSSRYKREHPDTWKKRIIHFLLYTRYAFAYLGFQFLKFIGDEVMLFWPLKEEEKPLAARSLYDFVITNQWYLNEVNRFNPSGSSETGDHGDHTIKVKVFCGEVNDALVFQPSDEGPYDLVGEDVDRSARIKESAQPNFFVADEGFKTALHKNGGPYLKAFESLAWENAFKGIGGATAYFGEKIPDAVIRRGNIGEGKDFKGLLFNRRSLRDFSSQVFDEKTLNRILAAAMSAPSAGDQQPWEFVLVRERANLEALSRTSPYAGPLAKAAAAVVVCGAKARTPLFPEYWIQDCSAAMENLLIQAVAEGAGGVWLGYFPDQGRVAALRSVLNLPSDITPLGIAALGYPASPTKPRSRFEADRIHREKWDS